MICIDTTVLIDEFRARGSRDAPVNRALLTYGAEILIVPVIVAGEFLDGAAMVSEQRFHESLGILRRRRVVSADLETAQHYGRIAAFLRRDKNLAGKSQNDLWIAATARCHGARVLTRNASDFEGIPELEVVGYGES
ncbi:MAG: type II toxin-antitoxin system VapC family toxin [Verrucomicrobia bacterium]|nr:type II toxin-antitoxin system VapC family toxin [Verrucomicrobiota bacterium]